jgi:hypothetical protein
MIFEGVSTKSKKTLTYVGNLPKKLATKDKTKPLGFQGVGPKNGQLGVTRFEYFIVPSGMGKC